MYIIPIFKCIGVPSNDELPLVIMGLCPLLFVATSIPSAAIIGGVFFAVLVISNVLLSFLRLLIPYEIRLPIVLLITTLVANIASLFINTFFYPWHLVLNIYVPLLAVNCLILNSAEAHALRYGIKDTVCRCVNIGGYVFVGLLCLGIVRAFLSGMIWVDFDILLAGLPAGAFLLLGFLSAWAQHINSRLR